MVPLSHAVALNPKQAPVLNALDAVTRGWFPRKAQGHWIFGLPKSGTTVFAAALSEVTSSSALLDTPLLWGTANKPLKESEMKALVAAHPVTFSPTLWKEPNATFYPEAAMAASPSHGHILLVRGALQNIRSHMDRLGLKGDATSVDLAALQPNHRPAFLAHADDPPALTLARRWRDTHNKACWNTPEVQVHTYESFMANPGTVQASAQHLGLPVLHEPCSFTCQNSNNPAGPTAMFVPRRSLGDDVSGNRSTHHRRVQSHHVNDA